MALRPAPELLHKVTKSLGITALDQWYYVSHHTVKQVIGKRALNEFGGTVASFLKYAYPQHHFNEAKLASKKTQEKDQKFVEITIRKLFPNTEINSKARKAVGIVNPDTEAYLEIDFWIPSLKLGIEYQDKHHYGYQWYANDSLENYQKRDEIKKATMAKLGYTLITVGYWWDRSMESMAATIRKHRPDLLQEYEHVKAEPVPSEPLPGYNDSSPVIPGVAGIMSPFIPTGNDFNPTNWYAGEKHDGIRGVYNPELNKMFSRSGTELSVPSSLLRNVPRLVVEGEITAGRGNYNKTVAVSHHTHHDKVNWPMLRYILFDIPDAELGNYAQRYSTITNALLAHPFIFAQPTFRVQIGSKSHLELLMDAIISDGGEGVIAQQDTRYEYGRAKGLAKMKVRRDSDARVLRVNKLSCTCKLTNGVTADLSFYTDFIPTNIKVGDIVSYYHYGNSLNGIPKKGEIYKVRYDVRWADLTSDKESRTAKRRLVTEVLGSSSLLSSGSGKNKMGHWNKAANVRAFFDEFARTVGFDPLVPDNWYLVRYRSLQQAGGGALLSAYSNVFKKALIFAYPELTFDAEKFRTHDTSKRRNHLGDWNKATNVRAFFDKFARTAGFDPLVPGNWYSVTASALQTAGGKDLLHAYNYSIRKALLRAYPKVKFGRFRSRVTNGHYATSVNVRAFFDEFARTCGFDPLVPENWYSVKYSSLQNAGGSGVLKHFSLAKALAFAYPEVEFKTEKFRVHDSTRGRNKKGHWNISLNVLQFFDKFARIAGFDPLIPENWYPVRVSTLQNAGGGGLLNAYSYDIKRALLCAYPQLKFSRFRTRRKTKAL